jgi:menaquinone-dependent protoporphyrinogen oxidase
MNILVAYATRNGSTQEVAEAIVGTLRACGADARLQAARDVRSLAPRFELIVLGAPIYSGRWHRDAHRFLRRHRKDLGTVPVAVFGMGPRRPDPQAWQRSRAQLDRALAKHSWLQPVAVTVFGGTDPPKPVRRCRDLRDWTQIEAWATSLANPTGWPAAGRRPAARSRT